MSDIARRYADSTATAKDRLDRAEAEAEAEWERKHTEYCKHCGGLGWHWVSADWLPAPGNYREQCPACGGKGSWIKA